MKLLKTIQLKELPEEERKTYRFRRAARAIVFDGENKIAILHSSKFNYHKLPGGGVEAGEDILSALDRECLEETGCDIEIESEIGRVIEYRDEFNLYQESFCYLAKIKGEKKKPKFTMEERNNGFSLCWMSIDDAIKILQRDKPTDYSGKFIVQRDLIFLRQAENDLNI